MKSNKIEDAVGRVDDDIIMSALEIDSAEKLRDATGKERRRKSMRVIRNISAAAACLCVCVLMAFVLTGQSNPNEEPLKVGSPITEVGSAEEMQKYLGFSVPVSEDKEIIKRVIYAHGDYVYMGEIVYGDGTGYKISRGSGDISGIYGAKLDGSVEYESVNVYYYSLLDTHYAIWSHNGYSFCYYLSDSETDFAKSITELINQIENN